MRALRTIMPVTALWIAAVALAACSPMPDPMCAALDRLVTSAVAPFSEATKGVKEAQRRTGFPPPAGLEGAAGCTKHDSLGASVFECQWVGQADKSGAPSSRIAERVEACLVPKGWVKSVQGNAEVAAHVFTREGQRTDVTVIFTGLGGLQRDSLMIRMPASQ